MSMQTGIRQGNLRLSVAKRRIVKRLFIEYLEMANDASNISREMFSKGTASRRPLIRVIILGGYSCLIPWVFKNGASQPERIPLDDAMSRVFVLLKLPNLRETSRSR